MMDFFRESQKLLLDFEYKRTFGQAARFYIGYLILIPSIALVVHDATHPFIGAPADPVSQMWLGAGMVAGIMLVLSFGVLYKKGLSRSPKHVAISLLPLVGAVFGGAVVGLLPVAYLTTVAPVKRDDAGQGA